ncbi:patatin-like phospholipase family protein [Flavobacteriaceae bacterium M23B6Z8]
MSKKNPVFHLGLTMAGAVSAGAYTAGFIDYLLEALDNWEEAKEKNKNASSKDEKDLAIPMHDVVIDAIGGASAGGMVGMITALSFLTKARKPVRAPLYQKTGNILYDSWVFLDDDLNKTGKSKTTFEKMLATDDLSRDQGAPSLMNSKPIDRIAEEIFDILPPNSGTHNIPKYVSEDLRILLTITSLRPLDYKVNFSRIKSKFLDTTPGHRISNHDIVGHYKIKYDEELDNQHYLHFNPLDPQCKAALIKATKATGAFPIGLAPRYFDDEFSSKYIETSLKRRKAFTTEMDIDFEVNDTNFAFTGVDGGTINNEPFDEVIRCLVDNHGKHDPNDPRYGTIMIDPFPNFEDRTETDDNHFQKSLLDVIGKLIPTILNQARNKRSDTYGVGLFKLLAFPIKWKDNGKYNIENPLATGGLGGFGGFLDIEFRIHDFFLGRDNARNFLRGFLFLEYDEDNPSYLFKDLTKEAVTSFSRKIKDKDTGEVKVYMPIIPDLSKLTEDTNPYKYTVKEFPKFKREVFKKLEKPIRKRIKAILKAEIRQRVDGWLLRSVMGIINNFLSKRLTKWVMKVIEKDFTDRNM